MKAQANVKNSNQPETDHAEKPSLLGRYHLLERLSAGGMGEVFLAVSQSTRGYFKFVAIKRMIKEPAKDATLIKRLFENEGRIGLNLSHGNLIQMYEASVAEGELFYVMEYIEGINLNSVIKKSLNSGPALSLPAALHVLIEAAKGLSYVHSYVNEPCGIQNGIVHQDVSPQNIMLGFNGGVKLIDFGVAKEGSLPEESDLIAGKAGYMSPEQLRGSPATFRSDVFAFGVIMWELFSGRRLFHGPDAAAVKNLIVSNTIPDIGSVNPKAPGVIRKIINKALQFDPNGRYESGSALLADLLRAAFHLDLVPHSEHLISYLAQTFAKEKLIRTKKMQAYTRRILQASFLASAPSEQADAKAELSLNKQLLHDDPSQKDYRELIRKITARTPFEGPPKVIMIRDGHCFMANLALASNGKALLTSVAPEPLRGKPCLLIVKDARNGTDGSYCLYLGEDGRSLEAFASVTSSSEGSYRTELITAA